MKRKKIPLSEEEKAEIIRLHLENKTNAEVAEIIGIVTSTVQRHISEYYKSINDKSEYFDVDQHNCWVIPSVKGSKI
ncbi:MAG: Homeodomain-like domain [Bacteroidota bacterium]|jgi:DNA-directed RNA polymerase specialized sigma subunit